MARAGPPLLIALELEQARQRAAQAGWQIADVRWTTAAPFDRLRACPECSEGAGLGCGSPPFTPGGGRAPAAPTGALRVIGQRVVSPRALALVVAPSVALPYPKPPDRRQ